MSYVNGHYMFLFFIFFSRKRKISKDATTIEHNYINQTLEAEITYNALNNVDLADEHEYTKVQLNNIDATHATVANDNTNSNKKQRTDVPSGKIKNDEYSEIQDVRDISRDKYETIGNN